MKKHKKIGVFDSGLGGIYIANAIRKRLPSYDYVYLGDTLHLPYGRRSDEAIYDLSENAMRYLFRQKCDLVIMACNTASAAALRKLQQQFLVREFPHHRILGVIVPTLEVAIEHGARRIGMLATQRTVHSNMFEVELQKINPGVRLFSVAAPLLVPLIEHEGEKYLDVVLADYLKPLEEHKIESLILGCTHYISLKERLRKISDIDLISQDEIIPWKLEDYLRRHPEIEGELSQGGTLQLHATDVNESFMRNIDEMMGQKTTVAHARY